MRTKPRAFAIARRRVAPDEPPYVIAEAGVNHNGDVRLALRLVEAAAQAGADAVKFQAFRTERLVSRNAPRAAYQARNAGQGSQADLLRPLELAPATFATLRDAAKDAGIHFLCTPFDDESLRLVDSLGVPAFKVGSGDLTNTPFLRRIAAKGKPVIASTGMATMAEVEQAHRALKGCPHMFLHCTSDYPARPVDLNLRAIPTMRRRLGVEVGYSDHSEGVAAAAAAVALGATLLEKHLTLDRGLPGPDHKASLEPTAMRQYVETVRAAHQALGAAAKRPVPREVTTARIVRKSAVAARDLPAGWKVRRQDLDIKRPGTGIPPAEAAGLVGRRLARPAAADEPLTPAHFAPPPAASGGRGARRGRRA